MISIKKDTVVCSSRVDQAYNKTMDVSDVLIAQAGDVSRVISTITRVATIARTSRIFCASIYRCTVVTI